MKKPLKIVVPVATGLAWRADPQFICQEKMDGRFHVQPVPGGVLLGELMPGEGFVAWDCSSVDGESFLRERLEVRLLWRDELALRAGIRTVQEARDGAGLLRAVLARRGEGVVRKRLDAPYGEPMIAAKRVLPFLCRVVGMDHGTQTVSLEDAHTGQFRGHVAMRRQWGSFRPGSVIKVEAFEEHKGGKLREARPCRDTEASWLVTY